MRWNIRAASGQVVGPSEETDIIASLRAGHYRGATAAPEGSELWQPMTAHPPFAGALGAGQAPAPAPGGEGIGVALLLIPLAAVVLTWVWVGNMNLLQNPSSALVVLTFGTIMLTGLLIAVEASQLGMGKKLNPKGKLDSGPVAWFLATCLLWIVVFPMYLIRRGAYGRTRYVAGSILVAVLFSGSALAMNAAIESRKAEAFRHLHDLQDRLRNMQSDLTP